MTARSAAQRFATTARDAGWSLTQVRHAGAAELVLLVSYEAGCRAAVLGHWEEGRFRYAWFSERTTTTRYRLRLPRLREVKARMRRHEQHHRPGDPLPPIEAPKSLDEAAEVVERELLGIGLGINDSDRSYGLMTRAELDRGGRCASCERGWRQEHHPRCKEFTALTPPQEPPAPAAVGTCLRCEQPLWPERIVAGALVHPTCTGPSIVSGGEK